MSKNVPRLRFPGFIEEWEEKKLRDECKFFSGGTPKVGVADFYNGNIPFIKSGEINKDKTDDFISENGLKESSAKLVKKGDLLYALYGATSGEVGISKINGAINQAVLCIRPISIKTEYLNQLLRFEKENIVRSYLQGGQGNLSAEIVKSLCFRYPDTKEQTKIANFLSTLDSRISLQSQKVEKLEELKKGYMQKIFSQELRFKREDGSEYGEWEDKKMGDVLKEVFEKTKTNNQYSVISSTVSGLFLQSEYFNRNIASENNVGYKILKRNQVVFSPQNIWMGNINFNSKFDIGIVSPSYKVFNVSRNCDESFIGYYIKTPAMMTHYELSSEQGASIVRRNLSMDMFFNIPVVMPELEEQTKIADFLSYFDKQIDMEKKELEKLQELKKGLLQQMFV